MIEAEKIVVGKNYGLMTVNSYLLTNNKSTIIIDPGDEGDKIISHIEENNLKLQSIILTHAHIDHIKDTALIAEHFKIPVFIHEDEKIILESEENNLSGMFGTPVQHFDIESYYKDNDSVRLSDEKLQIIHTPGHTPGGICIKSDSFLISGDTLFAYSMGRTDFPYGSSEALHNSIINKLLKLNDDLVVYPGHEGNTTIKQEKVNWGIM